MIAFDLEILLHVVGVIALVKIAFFGIKVRNKIVVGEG